MLFFDGKINQKTSLSVLTYHSIDESGSVISTKPETFRRQMRFLFESGYSIVSLKEAVGALTEGKKTLPKTAVLTFDDGFENFYTKAFPALEEYGFTATVFLVTDFCGKRNDWAGNPPELPRSRLLDWRQIRKLCGRGIEFGSHTRTHPDLTKIPIEKARNEILDSKAEIENRTGKKAEIFAYPYGKFDAGIKRIIAETFKAACSTDLGKIGPGSDVFALERIDSYYLKNEKIFSRLPDRSFDLYIGLRQMMRRGRSLVFQN